ncbi:MAG TPA: hypothetical protein VNM16_00045 [Bacillota bacterium]|nr:hypothetical protein [Bacillota bacterium]
MAVQVPQSPQAEISDAQTELAAAEALFNMAREPALVDHAIHRMLAAERRLGYLLQLARGEARGEGDG